MATVNRAACFQSGLQVGRFSAYEVTGPTAEMAAAARQARSRQVAARAADVLAVVRQVQAEGASSLRAVAAKLHAHGVLTPAGKLDWSPAQVQRLLKRENRASIVETH
jgi:hypothetical protein